jgi:predicted nucleic acid-binding protein
MPEDSGLKFLDTNVLVYAHDVSAGSKFERALQLIDELWESEMGCLSIQVLQEFYVTITTKVKTPLDRETAIEIVSALSAWKVHSPDVNDVVAAIEIQKRYQISFWDAMIVCSASKLNCDILWSEDLNDGQVYDGVKVVNPFQ